MSSPSTERPFGRTGALWGVLAVLLVVGAVGSATVVFGFLAALSGGATGWVLGALGAVVAGLALLFMVGILYRVDRHRGAVRRRVELFE